jgi:hypothetical protein
MLNVAKINIKFELFSRIYFKYNTRILLEGECVRYALHQNIDIAYSALKRVLCADMHILHQVARTVQGGLRHSQ